MIEKLCNLTRFDIDNGPYFIGSYLTHIVESRFREPNWNPNDLDIICRNRIQMYKLKRIFNPICTFYQERDIESRNLFNLDTLYMTWIIDDVKINAAIEDNNAMGHSIISDYTVNSFVSDGSTHLYQDTALDDVKNKILRFGTKPVAFSAKFYTQDIVDYVLINPYNKYIDRGYVDIDYNSKKRIIDFIRKNTDFSNLVTKLSV